MLKLWNTNTNYVWAQTILWRYNDGDPLSADDQTYILDNVFNHHPYKVQKTKFQESRCFFVVSTDGREEDFSYIKCVENYVKVVISNIMN